jgi:hypothetical protein
MFAMRGLGRILLHELERMGPMKRSFLLLSAALLGALAMSSQAQYNKPPAAGSAMAGSPASSSATTASPAKNDADYAAALAKCKGLVGAPKADCVRDAKVDYDRAGNQLPSGTAAGGAGRADAGVGGIKRN